MRVYIIRRNEDNEYKKEIKNGVKYIYNLNNNIIIDNIKYDTKNIYEIFTYIKGYRNVFYSKYN